MIELDDIPNINVNAVAAMVRRIASRGRIIR